MKRTKQLNKFIDSVGKELLGKERKENECSTCGKIVDKTEFRDKLSLEEYGISNTCQACQDKIFGKGN